jgi:hypothetical protein
VLASSLAAILGVAQAASTNYVLTGYVDQPGLAAPPVPAGVTVDLVSRATGAVYTSVVSGTGGQFTFSTTSTSGALVPGYWAVYVPAATNTSITGCKPCAVLPSDQNPVYQYYNSTQLTNATYSTSVRGVSILPYNATLNGTVYQGAGTIQGATVRLLAPTYNGVVLVSNVTNASGKFSLSVPFGTWVLQVTHASGPDVFSNTSSITIASRTPAAVSPVLRAFEIAGHVLSSLNSLPVSTSGNATLFDPTNGYIYSVPTAAGGYYQFSTYPAGFTSGSQTFDVIAASTGFQTGWFAQTVSGPSTVTQNVTVAPMAASSMGVFATTIDLTGVNVTTGHGNVVVATNAALGNDSALPGLPNATVGQLWAQLGLDLNHSLTFPGTSTAALQSWVTASGPFFPAVQAATTINGTGLVGPQGQSTPTSFVAPACSPSCGLTSSASLAYSWNSTYSLNGSIPKNATSYVLSFRFGHPSTTADVYNYTVKLPSGYVLSAGTTAPAHTKLVGVGPGGTWTHFTLVSQASTTPSASATFTLVKAANLTAIVNITVKSFPFSQKSVTNSTRGSYTVSFGPNQNATFSAANSTFPAGTNGTSFKWNFGDGHIVTVTNLTTNHTYSGANGSTTWDGSLTITSSGGRVSSTPFFVWIVTTPVTAVITSNATATQNHTGYVAINWNTSLQFSASKSINGTHDPWSDAVFKLTAKDFNASRNNSVAAGGSFDANWSVSFGGGSKPGAGLYLNFADVLVNSAHVAVTGWGWMYNLTLTVYSGSGAKASTTLVILVSDKEKPVPSITLQGPGGNTIGSNGVVEGSNGHALVRLNASGSVDPGNGTILWYNWSITLKGNSSFSQNFSSNKSKPINVSLLPQNKTYRVNLTVVDKNGNKANTSKALLVSKNSTTRPIMEAANLTGPSTVNVGTSYTYWVNITVGGGALANATNVSVSFFLRSASGTGSKTIIAGTPASVTFYGYSNNTPNATVNSTPLSTSSPGVLASLPHGTIVRAVISWNPGTSGSYTLYANVTAANEFAGDYGSTNIASQQVTVKPNPVTFTIEIVAVVVLVIAIIGGLIFYWRRRSRRPSAGGKPASSGRGGLERGKASDDEDDES